MALPVATLTLLRRAFADVCCGHSVARYKDADLYVKHLSHRDHTEFDQTRDRFYAEALSRGAETDDARLAYLISKGLWSADKEDAIAKQRDYIWRLEEGRKTLPNPSMLRQHDEHIKGEKEKMNKMLVDRAQEMGITAEVYAAQRLNDHYILNNLFMDREMKVPALKEDYFDDMSDSAIQEIIEVYNQASVGCSDQNLRLLSVQEFFVSYYSLCGDSLADFFGRPIVEMTYYMVRLGGYARHFRNLMENCDLSKVPREDRTDPDRIEAAYTSQKNQSQLAAEGRVANVRMTKEDIASAGLQGQMAKLPARNMSFNDLIKHVSATSTPLSG